MALDGIVINKIVLNLRKYLPMRINKIYDSNRHELLFHVRANRENKVLLINTAANSNRIHFTNRSHNNKEHPTNFVMLLRKHLLNGSIVEISQSDFDRLVVVKIENRNNIGDKVHFNLYLEFFGRFSNIIICDNKNKIIDASKRISPLENPNTAIIPGAYYQISNPQNKANPFKTDLFDINESLVKQFSGFSPTLEKEIRYRFKNNHSFLEIMKEIKQADQLVITNYNQKVDFHVIPLLHLNGNYNFYPIHQGFDRLYYKVDQREAIANETKDLKSFIKKQSKKSKRKLIKLKDQMEKNSKAEINLTYGDLLITYQDKISKGMNYINLIDYNTKQEITVNLDEKLDAIANAKKYYKLYRKQKNSIHYLNQEIDKTEKEIKYFQLLLSQLDYADLESAQEIRKELIDNKYLFEKNKKIIKKAKKPKYLKINYDDNIIIRVGKNNVQNDYVTFKASKKDDMWFHVQDYHGAHVVASGQNLSPEIIVLCANLAAYYSQARNSNNINVNYTKIKNIKKIPKAALGMVAINNYKTINIKIDSEIIEDYIN